MSEIGVFVRNCIEIDRDKEKSKVLSMWIAHNYDHKAIKEYVDGKGATGSKEKKEETDQDWKRLARTMMTMH